MSLFNFGNNKQSQTTPATNTSGGSITPQETIQRLFQPKVTQSTQPAAAPLPPLPDTYLSVIEKRDIDNDVVDQLANDSLINPVSPVDSSQQSSPFIQHPILNSVLSENVTIPVSESSLTESITEVPPVQPVQKLEVPSLAITENLP